MTIVCVYIHNVLGQPNNADNLYVYCLKVSSSSSSSSN